eukprot:2842756-Prymnesium_polylepis.1
MRARRSRALWTRTARSPCSTRCGGRSGIRGRETHAGCSAMRLGDEVHVYLVSVAQSRSPSCLT